MAGENVNINDAQVEIIFSTKLPEKFQVSDDPVVVPTKLARYGLSELINHMLENESPVPMDFLINGQFLRTTLAKYMQLKNVTAEQTLEIEYVLAMPQPESNEIDTNEDWLSGVVAVDGEVISASYDGCVRFYRGEPLARYNVTQVTDVSLKCVAAFKADGILQVATGTRDGRVFVHSYDESGRQVDECVGTGHADSVDAIAFNEDGMILATAGPDGKIILWNVAAPSPKRKRAAEGLATRVTLEGHTQAITSLKWSGIHLLSGSIDMSVRVWDIASGSEIVTFPTGKAVNDFDYVTGSLVTAHNDGKVHAWNVVSTNGEFCAAATLDVAATFNAFKRVVSQIQWSSETTEIEGKATHTKLSAISQDGHLKVLDIRSTQTALQTCFLEGARLLCMDKMSETMIVTGAHDGKLRVHTFHPFGGEDQD